jgi:MFS family permease
LACASVDLLALMDQTTLAAALTIVSRDLNASSESAWIAGAYFLTSTSFQLLYGRLSDIWSRKVLLVIGIGIFFLGSLAASLARKSLQLIVFRAFTGIGGGGLMTVAQLIVSDIVPLRERGKYQGILVSRPKNSAYAHLCPQGSVVALANGIGPPIGAALASQSTGSWFVTAQSHQSIAADETKEMDFPAQPVFKRLNDSLCRFPHALEKGAW